MNKKRAVELMGSLERLLSRQLVRVHFVGWPKFLWLASFLVATVIELSVCFFLFPAYLGYAIGLAVLLSLIGAIGFYLCYVFEGRAIERAVLKQVGISAVSKAPWLERVLWHALFLEYLPKLDEQSVRSYIESALPNRHWWQAWRMLVANVSFKGFQAWLQQLPRGGVQNAWHHGRDIQRLDAVCDRVARYIEQVVSPNQVAQEGQESQVSIFLKRFQDNLKSTSYIEELNPNQPRRRLRFTIKQMLFSLKERLFMWQVYRYAQIAELKSIPPYQHALLMTAGIGLGGVAVIWLILYVVPMGLLFVPTVPVGILTFMSVLWLLGCAVVGLGVWSFCSAPQLLRRFRLRAFQGIGLNQAGDEALAQVFTKWSAVLGFLKAHNSRGWAARWKAATSFLGSNGTYKKRDYPRWLVSMQLHASPSNPSVRPTMEAMHQAAVQAVSLDHIGVISDDAGCQAFDDGRGGVPGGMPSVPDAQSHSDSEEDILETGKLLTSQQQQTLANKLYDQYHRVCKSQQHGGYRGRKGIMIKVSDKPICGENSDQYSVIEVTRWTRDVKKMLQGGKKRYVRVPKHMQGHSIDGMVERATFVWVKSQKKTGSNLSI